jgi:hypothetical protein
MPPNMEEGKIYLIKNVALKFLSSRGIKGATLEMISQQFLPDKIPISELRIYLDELYIEDYIYKTNISGDRIIYGISGNGKSFLIRGGYSIKPLTDDRKTRHKENLNDPLSSSKKILFISYANDNYDKVKHIKKELENHPLFEPLVIADRRKPNEGLVKLIKEGIESAYCVIPILSPQSFKTQWINQEIGYAEGTGVRIIPIVESTILNDLKGFVHSQNQCPYLYTARLRLYLRDENKDFMNKFRLLIKDLEEEANINRKPNKGKIIIGTSQRRSNQKWHY